MTLTLKSAVMLAILFAASACNGPQAALVDDSVAEQAGRAGGPRWKSPTPSPSPSPNPSPSATTSPAPSPSPTSTTVTATALIFGGTGTNVYTVQAVEALAKSHGLTYRTVNSATLNSMSLSAISSYGTILWPGGNSSDMSASLTADTRNRVRQAVIQNGVSFTGFCAGAWIAVGPPPGSQPPVWGLAIVPGDYLKNYFPNGQYPSAAMVPISFPSGATRNLLWEDGPFLPSVAGTVIGKYPDGTAAIIETWAGKGYVTMTGVHPEAPQSWRDAEGLHDSDGLDYDIAWSMVQASLTRTGLAVF